MSTENKFLIGIAVITVLIIGAGIFLLAGKQNTTPQADENFDTALLTADAQYTKGNPSASVTVVEFADLQCPACKVAQPIINRVVANNQEKVYFVFRHYPLSSHKNSKIAAQASEAAGVQQKFFEYVDLLYEKQSEWENETNPREKFRELAQNLGLDMERFNSDMEKLKTQIEGDFALGNRAGVNSTPTFFINGQKKPGVLQEADFEAYFQVQTNTSE